MTDLSGKVAVVTGASRGLGQRVAVRLAAHGAALVLVARSEAALAATAAGIIQKGGRAEVVTANLSDPRSLDAIVEAANRVGPPSILVNAAGVFGPIQLIKDSDPREWIETLMINMVSHYLTSRAFVGGMIDQGWGRIVNVTSANALHPPGPLHSAYGTSKAALNHFTRHLAAEVEGSGVTANVIHPGDVKTEMWADIRAKAQQIGSRGAPFLQWADWVEETGGDDPEKAADLVVNLMGDDAASINGQFLWIKDGFRRRSQVGVPRRNRCLGRSSLRGLPLSPEPEASEVPALRRRSFRLPEEIGVIVALLAMIVVIGVARPRFLNPINLLTILGNTTFQGMLSLGMVFLLAIS